MQSSAPRAFVSFTAAGIAAWLLAACDQSPPPKPAAAPPAPPPVAAAPAPAAAAQPAQPAAASTQTDGDRALSTQVKSALAREAKLKSHQIDVVARDGKVTLFGTVEAPELRDAAQKLAAAVAGVKSVESKLVVVAGS